MFNELKLNYFKLFDCFCFMCQGAVECMHACLL